MVQRRNVCTVQSVGKGGEILFNKKESLDLRKDFIMSVIEFETTITETSNIPIPENTKGMFHPNEHVRVYVVPEKDFDRADELLFMQAGLMSFFKGYEDDDDFYQKKYGNDGKV